MGQKSEQTVLERLCAIKQLKWKMLFLFVISIPYINKVFDGIEVCHYSHPFMVHPYSVKPDYIAIKCNPDPVVLRLLNKLGTGFDCASKEEIRQILDMDVDPSRIIFANPCKPTSHIRFAASKGVRMMTFDNLDELVKIKKNHTNPNLVIRILADDSKSLCQFGIKFGVHMNKTEQLIAKVKELELNLVGVSFHVGSGCFDPLAYDDAIKRSKSVFEMAKKHGFEMKLLDIGGGFPSILSAKDSGLVFEDIAAVVNNSINKYFPNWKQEDMVFIGEPGRYFVSGAYSLSTNITSRREIIAEGKANEYMYYINDGVYGSFNCLIYDHVVIRPKVLLSSHYDDTDGDYESSIWGPTCDSMDLISKSTVLPKLEVDDWLYFGDMGAYTICAASEFNGFKRSIIFYTDTGVESFVKNLLLDY